MGGHTTTPEGRGNMTGDRLDPIADLAIGMLVPRPDGRLSFKPAARVAILKALEALPDQKIRLRALHSLLLLWANLRDRQREPAAAALLFRWIGEAVVVLGLDPEATRKLNWLEQAGS